MKNSWLEAVAMARKELGTEGFSPIKKGSKLYIRAKAIHDKLKAKEGGIVEKKVKKNISYTKRSNKKRNNSIN